MAPTSLTAALMATLVSLSVLTNGHMIITSPVPFSKDTLDTSPLKNAKPGSAGSDYPCKLRTNPWQISQMNNLKVGEEQTLAFGGSAPHGGGACQLSITLDQEPTVNSVFKVFQVFEGGCPLHNFTYTIPKNFPNGRATFAWTWYNLIGNREVYMNCAPITVSGGADNHDYFNTLPNQYLINLPTSECTSIEGTILKIPVPGEFVKNEVTGAQKIADATGPSCAASAAAQTQGVSGNRGSSGNTPSSSSASGGNASTPSQTPTVGNNGSGQVLTVTTVATSTVATILPPPAPPTSMLTVTTTSAPASSGVGDGFPTLSPSANAGVSPPAAALPSGSSSAPLTGDNNGSTGGNTGANSGAGANAGAGSASCSTDGAVVCNGPTQFGLCNFGKVVWQSVAAGTVCNNGVIQKREIARNVHNRRHMGRRAIGRR